MSNNNRKNLIEDKDKPNERQMKAEIYLKEYDIQNIITEMINYLLHKKSKNPILEMIKFLGSFLTEKEIQDYKINIPPPEMDYHPLIEFPKYKIECDSLLKEYLDTNTFVSLKDKRTKYGTDLGNIIRVNEVYPKDCLKKFGELFFPIIAKVHNLDKNGLKFYTENNFNLKNLKFHDIKKINLYDIKGLNKITLSISRNLTDEPFVSFINVENRTEKILQRIDEELKKKKFYIYNHLNEIDNNKIIIKNILSQINYNFDFWNAVNPILFSVYFL